jgi:hypothetical protein
VGQARSQLERTARQLAAQTANRLLSA